MKENNLSITGFIALAAGIVLIIANKQINSGGLVVAGGIIFIIAGLINVFIFNSERRKDRKGRGSVASAFSLVASIGAVVLGVCMLIFKDTFIVLIPYIFGIIIGFLGFYQFYVLAIGLRPIYLPGWFYIFPVILLGGAVYVFFRTALEEDFVILLVSGIAFVFFGTVMIIERIVAGRIGKEQEKKQQTVALDDASENKPKATALDAEQSDEPSSENEKSSY